MYLMAYHVPIFVDGPTQYISSDWRRTLEIQRDSLANFLPQTHVLGPRIEVGSIGHAVQTTLEVTSSLEGVQFTPSFPGLPSNRDFILRHRQRWIHDVAKLLPQASIIHAGIGNPSNRWAQSPWQRRWRRGFLRSLSWTWTSGQISCDLPQPKEASPDSNPACSQRPITTTPSVAFVWRLFRSSRAVH